MDIVEILQMIGAGLSAAFGFVQGLIRIREAIIDPDSSDSD